MPKNLIIFGAGASFGAGKAGFGWDEHPIEKVPALGADLFSDLQVFNPDGWGRLPEEFSKMFHEDFEKGIIEYSAKFPHALPPLQRAMAAYFFNFRTSTDSLYVRLGQHIQNSQWDGAIITLSYERLLEQSLCHVGLKPICDFVPKATGEIELCFPHGCCHIFCEGVHGTSGVSFGYGVTTTGQIMVVAEPKKFFSRIQEDVFPPVMSYFEPQKRTTSGVNFIESQRKRLRDLVLGAEQIAIVGMRVRSHDQHIWDPLAETNGKIIYCGGRSGGEEFELWRQEKRGTKSDSILGGYFAESFDEICSSIGLKRGTAPIP